MRELEALLDGEEFDWYVAISRGSLVPACLLAQKTKCKAIDTICLSRYDDEDESGPLITSAKSFQHIEGKRVLLIDDLVDKGVTMSCAKQMLGTYNPAVLKTLAIYKKSLSVFEPDFYIKETDADNWVVFPWEIEGRMSVFAV